MTNTCHVMVGFTHIKEKKSISRLRGSMPRERIKDIDKEAHVPTSTEDMMDQDSLEKNLTEGDEIQPKLRQ